MCSRAEEGAMSGNRILILLGVSLLAASAAWADDVGYVDCSNHPEEIQVFAKPRKTPELVESLPCGQRFTVLTYGFFFSRIQTGDGKVGFIYSSLIAVDRAATSAQKTGSLQMAADRQKLPSASAPAAQPTPAASIQPKSPAAQTAPAQATGAALSIPETVAEVVQPNARVTAKSEPVIAQPTATPAPAPASSTAETAAVVSRPAPTAPAPAQPQPAPAQPASAEAPASVSRAPEKTSAAALPNPPASAQPEPATPAIRPAADTTRWEKPNPTVRTAPLMELYGGYSFARLVSSGSGTNLNGALGSFGWSIKPWLQIVADTSYNVVTTNGTKNVLYGNHYGPRFFRRVRNRWGITPFGEALFGGSRADTTIPGSGGYTSSDNTFSIKVGGGLDIHPSRRWDIRLFDADYYRTSFGTNVHQNNYWISTGVVLRLFGGSE
jgi:hypothetical protein